MAQTSTRVVIDDRRQRMRRIRSLSRVMAAGCLVASGLLTASMALYWTTTPTRILLSQVGIANGQAAEIDFPVRALAFVISMIPLGALAYGLLNARRCFKAFSVGNIFSREPTRHLRAFAVAVAVSALLKPFAGAALSVLLSASSSAGAKTLVLNIGSDTLIALIFSGTVAVIAWVMTEASDVSDENKQFV
ncbi:DUF2975 domain-containing protein [Rhizobium daejeonense]